MTAARTTTSGSERPAREWERDARTEIRDSEVYGVNTGPGSQINNFLVRPRGTAGRTFLSILLWLATAVGTAYVFAASVAAWEAAAGAKGGSYTGLWGSVGALYMLWQIWRFANLRSGPFFTALSARTLSLVWMMGAAALLGQTLTGERGPVADGEAEWTTGVAMMAQGLVLFLLFWRSLRRHSQAARVPTPCRRGGVVRRGSVPSGA
ncbi:hypothetical protein [Streptomyces sp. NPDC102283]|uniref:hypothetical protein n=1 Tax=Streptomyces sp. NPDC102283 TaxID=3366155 RepID=UPI00381AB13E